MYDFAFNGLLQYWYPEIIAGKWNSEHSETFSYSSVYRAVRAGLFPGVKPLTHFRRKAKPYSNQKKSYTQYFESSIHDREQVANERSRLGDFEGDTVYGSVGKGYLITAVDRKSRQLIAEIAKDKRKFAMVHFASADNVKTDLFEPGHYTSVDVINAAEQFFGGGTDFEAPLTETINLMEKGYENADITIITDGECRISDEFAEKFRNTMLKYKATVTGILLDKDRPCGKTLEPFCDKIYHSKEITEDEIARQILRQKAS